MDKAEGRRDMGKLTSDAYLEFIDLHLSQHPYCNLKALMIAYGDARVREPTTTGKCGVCNKPWNECICEVTL
jgi:hypothetical protein